MEKEHLIELTNKLYRLTLLFPKKEPLRYKIREAADELLANWISWGVLQNPNPAQFAKKSKELIFELENNSQILNGYLEVAKWQNWASFFDVLEIQEEYGKLGSEIKERKKELEGTPKDLIASFLRESSLTEENPAETTADELDERKEKILEYLREKGKAQVWEINKIFPNISKRTLRRDFHYLLQKGMIDRIGEKNDTFYQLA